MSLHWIFFCIYAIILVYLADIEEVIQMAMSDLQKLIENMKRAQSITERASQDAAKHSVIMDNFEKRMDLNHETMLKIEEYEKLMSSMDAANNGGPPLDDTFPSTVAGSTAPEARFDAKTGRQL